MKMATIMGKRIEEKFKIIFVYFDFLIFIVINYKTGKVLIPFALQVFDIE